MLLKIIDKEFNDIPESRMKNTRTYFSRHDIEAVAVVPYSELKRMMLDEQTRFVSLKPGVSANSKDYFAVGLNTKNPKLKKYDVKYLMFPQKKT